MKKIIMFAVLALLAPMTYAEGNAAKGKDLAGTFLACHGALGNTPPPSFPTLAGQHASYLLKHLTEIHNGKREVLTMTGSLDNLSESALSAISAYYAG